MDRRHFIRAIAVTGGAIALRAVLRSPMPTARNDQALRRAALGARQHHPRQRDRLGPAASIYLSAPCGMEANADFAAIRARVQKMADIGPAFEAPPSAGRPRHAQPRMTATDHGPRQLVHGGDPLRRRRMALR